MEGLFSIACREVIKQREQVSLSESEWDRSESRDGSGTERQKNAYLDPTP